MLARIARSAATAAMIVVAAGLARGEDAPASNPRAPVMLVLRNGEVLEGHITHADGAYTVEVQGGRIRIKDADADVLCSSLEDGYRRKRALIQVGNVYHHLELAQWCLRHHLPGPTAVELADARVADPNNQMIAVLQHRLKVALEPPPPSNGTPVAAGPSNAELDRMVRGMPHQVVETFTQSVQPMLLNHCTGSGCHGPQAESGLRLLRVPTSKLATRRITQRNLFCVLQYVDRDNPAHSRLLSAAAKPHGTLRNPVFNERQASQFQRLIEWVNDVAGRSATDQPASVVPAEYDEPTPDAKPSSRGSAREGRKSRGSASERRSAQRGANSASKAKPKKDAAPRPTDPPGDPFDPDAFNRQNSPEEEGKQPPAQPSGRS
jgi:hypothetical protein